MTGRYQSPLYRSLVRRATAKEIVKAWRAHYENERQEEPMAHGHIPTRARLTYLKHHLEAIERGETPKGIGPQQGEILALVRLGLSFGDAKNPEAEWLDIMIPAEARHVRLRIAEPDAVVMESKPTQEAEDAFLRGMGVEVVRAGRGGGSGSPRHNYGGPIEITSAGGRGGVSTPYVEPITPAIPAEPEMGDRLDFSRLDYVEPMPWPEDPRAPKPPEDVPDAASDFGVGDWVVLIHPGASPNPAMKITWVDQTPEFRVLKFRAHGDDTYHAGAFRRATGGEITAAMASGRYGRYER